MRLLTVAPSVTPSALSRFMKSGRQPLRLLIGKRIPIPIRLLLWINIPLSIRLLTETATALSCLKLMRLLTVAPSVTPSALSSFMKSGRQPLRLLIGKRIPIPLGLLLVTGLLASGLSRLLNTRLLLWINIPLPLRLLTETATALSCLKLMRLLTVTPSTSGRQPLRLLIGMRIPFPLRLLLVISCLLLRINIPLPLRLLTGLA
jgi:hypothetical protein